MLLESRSSAGLSRNRRLDVVRDVEEAASLALRLEGISLRRGRAEEPSELFSAGETGPEVLISREEARELFKSVMARDGNRNRNSS